MLADMSIYSPCSGGEIISVLGQCDGRVDCFYGDDEMNCDTETGDNLREILYTQSGEANLYK